MRIPNGTTDQVVYFVAVDATDFTSRETGLTTFTVYRARNGGTPTAMTTPTVTEVDATNMPGVYSLLCDEDMTIGAGNDSEEMIFHISHAGMAPVDRTIELYRPKITAGNTLGVAADGDISGNVDGTVATVTTLTGHTPQTGDSFARIGALGAGLTAADDAVLAAIAALNNLDAAGIRTAIGLASANLDAQLAALPTAAENRAEMDSNSTQLAAIVAAVAVVDGIVDSILVDTGTDIPALISALNNLAQADIRTALGLATANMDTQLAALPTAAEIRAEIDSNSTQLAALIAAVAVIDGIVDNIFAQTGTTGVQIATGALDAAALSTDAVQEIRDAIAAMTITELAAIPAASPTLAQALALVYMAVRNKRDTTASSDEIHNDAGIVLATAGISDDTVVFSKAKYA